MKEVLTGKLRDKFFRECVTHYEKREVKNQLMVNMSPHDLFEWFRKNIEQPKQCSHPDANPVNQVLEYCQDCNKYIDEEDILS